MNGCQESIVIYQKEPSSQPAQIASYASNLLFNKIYFCVPIRPNFPHNLANFIANYFFGPRPPPYALSRHPFACKLNTTLFLCPMFLI